MVLDDEGNARDFYDAGVEAETGAGAEEQRKAFIEEESKRMREADKVDRAAAREAKREKKRKRKDREREVS
jgi:ATP-dependent RNA helicase DDX10/DBP4